MCRFHKSTCTCVMVCPGGSRDVSWGPTGPGGSVKGRISVAFVWIYSHNKDLVGDSWAGCVYIKEASQQGASASSNASGNTAAAVRRQSWEKHSLINIFIFLMVL